MSGCYGDSSDSQHRSPAQVIPSYLLGGTMAPMRLGPRRTLTSNCIFDRFCRFCKTHNMRAKQTEPRYVSHDVCSNSPRRSLTATFSTDNARSDKRDVNSLREYA